MHWYSMIITRLVEFEFTANLSPIDIASDPFTNI
jgi:hypothetical protein